MRLRSTSSRDRRAMDTIRPAEETLLPARLAVAGVLALSWLIAPSTPLSLGALASLGIAHADTCTRTANSLLSGSSVQLTATRAAKSSINFNANAMTPDCATNYYWVGIHGNFLQQTNPPTCDGAFAQVGYAAYISNGTLVARTFTYYQLATQVSGCGPKPLFWGQVFAGETHTYKVSADNDPYAVCGTGGSVTYYDGASAVHSDCTDWYRGNYVQTLSERTGTTSHIGAITYSGNAYCTSTSAYGCSPSTTYQPNFNNISSTFLDPYGSPTQLNTTDWKVCDNRNFPSSSACIAG